MNPGDHLLRGKHETKFRDDDLLLKSTSMDEVDSEEEEDFLDSDNSNKAIDGELHDRSANAETLPELSEDESNRISDDKKSSAKEKNRAHAKRTRQRKKDYVESLRETLQSLSEDRDRTDRERRVLASRLAETASVRKRVLKEVLQHRVVGNLDTVFWSNVLVEDFVLVLPITPYRSFPPVEVSDGERRVHGVNAVLMDVASLYVLFQTLKPTYGNDKNIDVRCVCDFSTAILTQESIMARWELRTTNAMSLGCFNEIVVHGMSKATFSVTNKLMSLELMFDVMSLMQQLRRSSHRSDFSIIPNTYQLAQESIPGARVITDSVAPYPILYVSPEWEEMFGYASHEVIGQSCKILQGPLTEQDKIASMMRFVYACLPCAATVTNYHKNGDIVHNCIKIFPLFAFNTVRYFVGMMERVPENLFYRVESNAASSSSTAAALSTRLDSSLDRQPIDNTKPGEYRKNDDTASTIAFSVPVPGIKTDDASAAGGAGRPLAQASTVLPTDPSILSSNMSGISRAFRLAQQKKEAAAAAALAASLTPAAPVRFVGPATEPNAGLSSDDLQRYRQGDNTFSKPANNVLYPPEVLSSLPRFPIVGLPPYPMPKVQISRYPNRKDGNDTSKATHTGVYTGRTDEESGYRRKPVDMGSDSRGSGSSGSNSGSGSTGVDSNTTSQKLKNTSMSEDSKPNSSSKGSDSRGSSTSGKSHSSQDATSSGSEMQTSRGEFTVATSSEASSSQSGSQSHSHHHTDSSGHSSTYSHSLVKPLQQLGVTETVSKPTVSQAQSVKHTRHGAAARYDVPTKPQKGTGKKSPDATENSDEFLFGFLNDLESSEFGQGNGTPPTLPTTNEVVTRSSTRRNSRHALWDSSHHGATSVTPPDANKPPPSDGSFPSSRSDSYTMGLSDVEDGPDQGTTRDAALPASKPSRKRRKVDTVDQDRSDQAAEPSSASRSRMSLSQTEFSVHKSSSLGNGSSTDFGRVFASPVDMEPAGGESAVNFDQAMVEMTRDDNAESNLSGVHNNSQQVFDTFPTHLLDQQHPQTRGKKLPPTKAVKSRGKKVAK